MFCELQKALVTGTPHERPASGRVRSTQVVVGGRTNVPESEFAVMAARFVPPPPGLDLEARLRDFMAWLRGRSLRDNGSGGRVRHLIRSIRGCP